MSVSKKGPVVEGGLCRCCGAVKRCRLLNVEYDWIGVREVYSEMFLDCFGLCLSHLDGDPSERLICATCVTRLRDASSFRGQVLRCEERMLQAAIQMDTDLINDVKTEPEVKEEADDGYEPADDLPLADATDDPPETEVPLEADPDHARGRRDMLLGLKDMRDQLRSLQAGETKEAKPPPPLRPWKSNSQKAFHNTTVLVENSYVCPFVTIFSDYHCVYCKELYTNPDSLREHTLTHDPTTYKDTVIYKMSLQIDIARIDCRLCPKSIDNLEDFYSHVTKEHDKMLYPNIKNEFLKFKLKLGNIDCLECGMAFTYFHALKRHMAEHFGTWICDVCGAHFFEENKLIMHQKSHKSHKAEDRFPCKDCGKVFKSKHGRYYHISRQHSDTPSYPCYKCDEVFFSYTLRYRHMIEAHGEQRKFPCTSCAKVYDTRKSLREHNRKNHLKVLRHECAVCEKKFYLPSALKDHMASHTAYDTRKSLREHNRKNHLKVLRHECAVCEKKFYLPSALKDHMASHTGERNFRCEYCGKSYPRMRALRVHAQSHERDKRHACAHCGAAYTQANNLRHHLRAKHAHLAQ